MLAIDLSSDFSDTDVQLHSISKPEGVPKLVQGGIWVDEENKVFYTGFSGRKSSLGDSAEQNYGLWQFKPNGAGSGAWTNMNNSADAAILTQPRPFSALVASGGGAGFMLGGFAVNTSQTDPGKQQIALSGLNTYNFTTQKLTNSTVSVLSGGINQMGGMVYVPNFGSNGILVVLGGDQVGKVKPGYDALLKFNSIQIYDVSSGKWFQQQTTGDVPENRKEFCYAGTASNNKTF